MLLSVSCWLCLIPCELSSEVSIISISWLEDKPFNRANRYPSLSLMMDKSYRNYRAIKNERRHYHCSSGMFLQHLSHCDEEMSMLLSRDFVMSLCHLIVWHFGLMSSVMTLIVTIITFYICPHLPWARIKVTKKESNKYLLEKWRRGVEYGKLSPWYPKTRVHCPPNQTVQVLGVIHKIKY